MTEFREQAGPDEVEEQVRSSEAASELPLSHPKVNDMSIEALEAARRILKELPIDATDAQTVARALLSMAEGRGSVAAGAGPFDLLPCPFCGGREHVYYKIERTPDDMHEVPFYVCGQCAAEGAKPLGSWRIGEDASHEMAFSAASAWNRRASSPTSGLTQAAKPANPHPIFAGGR